jgi:hypothetical protein
MSYIVTSGGTREKEVKTLKRLHSYKGRDELVSSHLSQAGSAYDEIFFP